MAIHVTDYSDYRAFLRDAFAERKAGSASFSYRRFSRQAGLKSTNYLKLVMDGQRNLTVHTAEAFARGFELNQQDSTYFVALVRYNQATTDADRTRAYTQMTEHRGFRRSSRLQVDQYAYFSSWHCVAIREMAALPGFRPDPHWIAKRAFPPITARQAQSALSVLLRLGMLKRESDGALTQAAPLVTGDHSAQRLALRNYHRQMLKLAGHSLDTLPPEQREFGAVSLRLDPTRYKALCQRLFDIAEEVMAGETPEGEPSQVFHWSYQLFPLSLPAAAVACEE